MANNNKKPTHTLRCGNIKATIWQNVSEKSLPVSKQRARKPSNLLIWQQTFKD